MEQCETGGTESRGKSADKVFETGDLFRKGAP